MRSSVFMYPYAKVFRKTQNSLSRWGLKITSIDALSGFIKAESGFSLLRPSLKVDFVIEEMENHDTKVTVKDLIVKNAFFSKKKIDTEKREAELLESLSMRF